SPDLPGHQVQRRTGRHRSLRRQPHRSHPAMSIVAIVPVAHMAAANAELEAQGFGPGNFSVQCFGATGCTHAALHCWPDAAFKTALESIPNVVVGSGDVRELIEAQGARWGDKAPELPDEGNVTAGSLFQ